MIFIQIAAYRDPDWRKKAQEELDQPKFFKPNWDRLSVSETTKYRELIGKPISELAAERGVHRLVRISPFDAQKRRHTSFASVDVTPELEEDVEVEINQEDLKVDTYRSSGAGGQHVNVTDSAVRITHLPTGIVVSCQNERSQMQNRAVAMRILKSRLVAVAREEREKELDALRGEKREIGFGSQIRSYVLHPYQMVKDHRTGLEVGNIQAVLDGDISGLVEAELRRKEQIGHDEKAST
jgi:peptide chain release factor 2